MSLIYGVSDGNGNAQSNLWQSLPQSPLTSKLKRTQTIASLNEIEDSHSISKKRVKRSKTTEIDGLKSQSGQRKISGVPDARTSKGQHIAEALERQESRHEKYTDLTVSAALEGENLPKVRKASVRRGRTHTNDDEHAPIRPKSSRRCASTVTTEMNDSWDRDQLDFRTSTATTMSTIEVPITTNLTRSQEKEYKVLNARVSQNSYSQTSQENRFDDINLIPNRIREDPSIVARETPAKVVHGYQPGGINHFSQGQSSTLGRIKSMDIIPAGSPHDTEEISSFGSSARLRRTSTSPAKEPSQPAPDSTFDEVLPIPVQAPLKEKPGRKRTTFVVEDSDESPDELNHPAHLQNGQLTPHAHPSEGNSPNAYIQNDDDEDIMAEPQAKDGPHTAVSTPKDMKDHSTRHSEEQLPNFDVADVDDVDMPPKEQYQPRPSRSRGKPIELESQQPSEMPQNASKKKKVKRGKTTSVILKKSLESDVEDDIVWVDEKPSGVVFRDPVLPARRKAKQTRTNYADFEVSVDEEKHDVVDTEPITDFKPQDEPLLNRNPEQPPAETTDAKPKKRGRKRKKTTETYISNDTPIDDPKLELKRQKVSNLENNKPLDDGGNVAESMDELQGDPTPDPPAAVHDKKEISTPEAENPKPPALEIVPTTSETPPPIETPKKQTATTKITTAADQTTSTPSPSLKGPDKHSPISTSGKVPYRVGLSRNARIAPLLRVVRK